MRLPRFRLATLMMAVAVVAIAVGIPMERYHRFGKTADHFRAEVERFLSVTPYQHLMSYSERDDRRLDWLCAMRLKYERAARYRWIPVPPDPPEPK